jgi:hypothetical protein
MNRNQTMRSRPHAFPPCASDAYAVNSIISERAAANRRATIRRNDDGRHVALVRDFGSRRIDEIDAD